jgi:hypothetical protein
MIHALHRRDAMDTDRRRPLIRPRLNPRPARGVRAAIAVLAALAALAAMTAPAARADDRALLHATQQNPYVMIILDTSGSMHQEVACTATDVANGFCKAQCDPGDCLPRMMGDDPDSKIYVAKQSIYTIMQAHPNINFGFAHFDQTQLRVFWKYWWYSLATAQPNGFIALDSGLNYPEVGQQELFGQPAWSCTLGGPAPFNNVGCISTQPAHLDNSWEWERARRYPKLGDQNTVTGAYYISESSSGSTPTYRVTYAPVNGQSLGTATLLVKVTVDKCTNSSCSSIVTKGTKTMTFNLANPTVYWDPGVNLNGTNVPDAAGNGGAFYSGNFQAAREMQANYSSVNLQLEPNTDTSTADQWGSCGADPVPGNLCNMLQPTTADAFGRTPANSFSIGDIVPLDWKSNQQTLIMNRMAPNMLDPLQTIPDFGIINYLADHPLGGEGALRLKKATQRPLAPEGGTPTGHVMMSFANLMTGSAWPPTFTAQASSSSSWIATASAASGDPFFSCKHAYVLLLTDGLASQDDGVTSNNPANGLPNNPEGGHDKVCPTYYNWGGSNVTPQPGFACCAAEALRTITYGSGPFKYPIRTYVVGLGLTTTTVGGYNNSLQCIADEGGTGSRHFFNGNPNTVPSQPAGFPASDPPPAGFCTAANPCDGPGPLLPQSKQDILDDLEKILNVISSQETAFAAAAAPSIQSNVQNKELITSFLPVNQPIWPGRVDAYTDPVPTRVPPGTTASVPDPTQECVALGRTEGCHVWHAGDSQLGLLSTDPPPPAYDPDTILKQALVGYDTNPAAADPTKRRVYYAPLTPIVAGERRLLFQMPLVTDTGHLNDLENALGLCGPGYSYYPPSSAVFTLNPSPNPCPSGQTATTPPYTTAQQAITFTEAIKTYQDPTTNQPVQYVLGDIFHSDPQVLGQPNNSILFSANIDNYQTFAAAQRFRRKVLYFGSNDGELHALDLGTVQQGTSSGKPAWIFGNGTGNEIFSFIPRTVMPTLNQLAIASSLAGGSETFMVDGAPHLSEGFFDVTGGSNLSWHSLVIGGLREGGHAYYALDVTQPDTLISNFETPNDPSTPAIQLPDPTVTSFHLPNCLTTSGGGCAQLPYATPLWEFTDSCQVVPTCTTNCQLKPCDEDPASPANPGIGQPDLGETWSRPNSGRVRICDSGGCATFHEQWVVVFGGGMDPATNNSQGNWLYMLDMATGKVIYKRQLNGSAPSEPAAVDTGQDGYIDTIYIGTTAGHLYKVDLTQPAPIDSTTGRVQSTYWKPFEIFDTQGRQMFYPPSVFFDSDINQYGLAWGTGNRFDLWKSDLTTGRFFVLIDTGFTAANTTTPLTAANLQALTPDGATNPNSNFLTSPSSGKAPGFYFDLAGGERVINEAFTLSGVLVFGTYQPQPITSVVNSNTVCADTGDTRVFVVSLDNGDPLAVRSTPGANDGLASLGSGTAGNGTGGVPTDRYFVLSKQLGLNITSSESRPFFTSAGAAGTGANALAPPPAPALSIQNMIKKLISSGPPNCRYSNKTIDVKITDTNNTTYLAAGVPVCIIEKNWKEF